MTGERQPAPLAGGRRRLGGSHPRQRAPPHPLGRGGLVRGARHGDDDGRTLRCVPAAGLPARDGPRRAEGGVDAHAPHAGPRGCARGGGRGAQAPLPYRDAQSSDFFVNIAGAVAGLLLLSVTTRVARSRSHRG